MNLISNHLRYFLETARLGSIRKASDYLNIAPSAVYRSIRNTELELGATLFERTSKGVELTPAGRVLAAYTERVFADGEHASDRIKTLAQRSASVSVAGPDGVVPEIVSASFNALLTEHPEVSTLFRGCSGADALAYLESGTVDLALHFDLQIPENLEVVHSRKLKLGAVVTPEHDLNRFDHVALDHCCEWPLILPDSSWPMRTLLNKEVARRGLAPEIRAISSSINLMKQLVAYGHGIGIQTKIGLRQEISEGKLAHIPLSEPAAFDRTLQLLTRRDSPLSAHASFVAEAIVDVIRQY